MKPFIRRSLAALAVASTAFAGVAVTAAPANAASLVGSPDTVTWCRVYFGGSKATAAPLDGRNPYSWRCLVPAAGGGWNWTNVGIDMNKACEYTVHEPPISQPTWKGDARVTDPHSAYSWYCFH